MNIELVGLRSAVAHDIIQMATYIEVIEFLYAGKQRFEIMPVCRLVILVLEIFRIIWIHSVNHMQAADDKIKLRMGRNKCIELLRGGWHNSKFDADAQIKIRCQSQAFCVSGILGLVLSFGAIVMLVIGWNATSGRQKAIFIIVALMFTVINPLSLAFKTFKQLKTSPSYKQPLVYTFSDGGIGVSQGEEHMDLEWKGVYRLLMTKYMLAVYTNRMHAFVIPLDQLGDDKGKILASVVNFTAGYKPRVSRSLKRYQSGKGI